MTGHHPRALAAVLTVTAGLLGPAVGRADHRTPPCPPPAACPVPGPKVVVELSPPEVTFKRAEPTCVEAPAGPRAGGCRPGYRCYPITIPAPQAPGFYAPAGYAAPVHAGYAVPAYAPPGYAVGYAHPVAVGYGLPVASAHGYGPVAASPGCGAAGLGHADPLAGLSAGDLEALARRRRALEETDANLHLADLQQRYNALTGYAKSAGIPLRGLAPSDGGRAAGGGLASPGPGAAGGDAEEVRRLRQEVAGLKQLLVDYYGALSQKQDKPAAKP